MPGPSEAGKGDDRRPALVPEEQVQENWDSIKWGDDKSAIDPEEKAD
jgi:hypothetical protein